MYGWARFFFAVRLALLPGLQDEVVRHAGDIIGDHPRSAVGCRRSRVRSRPGAAYSVALESRIRPSFPALFSVRAVCMRLIPVPAPHMHTEAQHHLYISASCAARYFHQLYACFTVTVIGPISHEVMSLCKWYGHELRRRGKG